MNAKRIKHATIGLALCGLTGAANADIIAGQPVTAPVGLSTASIEFRGSSAGYTGELYFLGWGTRDDVLYFAPTTRDGDDDDDDDDEGHLGQFLFNNHESAIGSIASLIGEFESGSVLHFAYKIISPHSKRDLFRTDEADDRNNFAYDITSGEYGIEDLRRENHHYDGDFNDAMFDISFQSIPAPGSLALLSLGSLAMTRRRRR